ncbi:MAG: MarR family winged helix-turn-helix transcriptional regulator [Planctomycetaceae bacterium]
MPESTPTLPARRRRFASLEQEVFLNLWRTYDRLRMLEDELFSHFDLTAQQYNVLRILRAAAPQPLPTLVVSERLISRAPDITRMIDRLEERSLVERRRDSANRRVVLVAITAAGEALLQSVDQPLRDCHRQQLGHMAKAQLEQLRTLLQTARSPHEADDSPWAT